ncbi:MAG: ACP S-malonyltransferase [Microcystaceae cyanobacterium]
MQKIAWVFPGQGSQTVGMGTDLIHFPFAKTKFEQAEQILGWSVIEMCQGDDTQLSQTLYTQPCLYVIETILSDLLLEQETTPHLVAGHSLGEYSALYTAKVFDFATGLSLVKQRAALMNNASGGKMAALMKFDRDRLEAVINSHSDLVLANDNSEQQVVISGTPTAVDQAITEIAAKRAVPLKVSGAFHSPMMTDAAQKFKAILSEIEFKEAQVAVLSNVDPTPTTDPSILKARLVEQMTGSVRWRETMAQLSQENVTQAVEVGPGKVLAGLLKRACKGIMLRNVSTVEDL